MCCPLWAQTDKITDSILQESTSLIYTDIGKGEKQAQFLVHSQSRGANTVQALLVLADAAYLKGNFATTARHLSAAQKNSAVHSGNTAILLALYSARYYRLFGFGELSRQQLKQALQSLRALPKDGISASGLWARYYLEASESTVTKSPVFDLLQAQKKAKEIAGTVLQDQVAIALASEYTKLGNFSEARNTLQPILTQDRRDAITARALLESAWVEKADAKPYAGQLLKAYRLLETCTDVPTQKEVCGPLSEYFLATGQVADYKKYLSEFKAIDNQLMHNTKAARDNVIAALETKRGQAQANTYYFVAAALLSLLLLYGIYAYFKARQDYRKFLKAMEPVPVENPARNPVVIPQKTEAALLEKLAKFEKSNRFTNPSLTIQSLAKSLDTNTKYLSEVINRNKNANFNQYVNELRINYIIAKMKEDPKYLNYKIYYLAKESGFASQSTFSTVFRASTGISPLSFIKFLKNEKQPS